ncbi:nuclear pore glycoprotein p62-like [Hydractinia symbiolongicarpus]|uniref:nuclear pore glycoprotein p62-like n=1 Tax=Hydractinia symbiolongicarpus TaxID=13093 RepID=UPI00254D8B7F|nr:nuclear pore glycoprotein p62-like [Hydractinia symbiolongicarpus]
MTFNFKPGGFNFGGTTSSAAPVGGQSTFSFGGANSTLPANSTTGTQPSFNFASGNTAPSATTSTLGGTGFSFSAASTAGSTAQTIGSNFGSLGGAKPFSFGAATAVTTQAAATKPNTTAPFAGLSTSKTNNAPQQSGFSFSNSTTSTSGGMFSSNLLKGQTTSAAATTPFAVASSATSTPSLSLGTSTAKQFTLSTSTTATASTGSTIVSTGATTNLASAAATQLKQMSYKELEETVEKWLHDLGEQEKTFLNQASQVNLWDRQLIENGEKVTELHNEVERVKSEQKRLDRELDFILSQQEELEELLQPLETQVKSQQALKHSQHSDIERERTFRMAENIDSQLKTMMQDLKEIIDYINKSHVSPSKTDDTMSQVAKILNAHMDSLQWIDQNANQLQQRMKDVSQLVSARKRNYDRTFHLT